jgi:hypothetical protein
MIKVIKGRRPSNSGTFGYADTLCRLADLSRRFRSPHTAFATPCILGCGYRAGMVARRRPLRWYECLFDPTCHCGASFVVSSGTLEAQEGGTYFTQFSQWNSNSSRAVFDLMFLSFFDIVTSDTVEDLPYKAWYRSQMASLHAMTICTCRANWSGATDSGKGYEIETLPWVSMVPSGLFKTRNPVGESERPHGRGSPPRGEFGGRFNCSGG